MTAPLCLRNSALACLAAICGVAISLAGETAGDATAKDNVATAKDKEVPAKVDAPAAKTKTAEADEAADVPPVPTATAREHAKIMHNIYASTLEVMHQRYFHDERAAVPARALEDVFAEMTRQSNVKARWISVNTRAMSIDHEPKDAFERKAAAAISDGKPDFEQIAEGRYYRAAPIPLSGGCIGCHTGHFAARPKAPRFAGLIISIPVSDQPQAAAK